MNAGELTQYRNAYALTCSQVCSTQGPMGPQGPIGPEGPPGPAGTLYANIVYFGVADPNNNTQTLNVSTSDFGTRFVNRQTSRTNLLIINVPGSWGVAETGRYFYIKNLSSTTELDVQVSINGGPPSYVNATNPDYIHYTVHKESNSHNCPFLVFYWTGSTLFMA